MPMRHALKHMNCLFSPIRAFQFLWKSKVAKSATLLSEFAFFKKNFFLSLLPALQNKQERTGISCFIDNQEDRSTLIAYGKNSRMHRNDLQADKEPSIYCSV